jgi:hypothetical protein
METWRRVFRVAAGLLSDRALAGLGDALGRDDQRLFQGGTTDPPALTCTQDSPCGRACLLAFPGMAEGLETVGEVEEFFAQMCYGVDRALGEPAGVRHLLAWYDDTPREGAFRELLAEVRLETARRGSNVCVRTVSVTVAAGG